MGLDGVELVMELEDRFATSIPDSATEHILTVGQLHSFLMKRICDRTSGRCQSAAMFYPIRRMLVSDFDIQRSAVVPSASLASLVDAKERYKFWRKLESSVASQLPRLERSHWLQWNGETFPESISTVAQLVRHCVEVNQITDEFGPNDSDTVWEIVCELVAEVTGVKSSTLKPETQFARDLWF